MRRSANDIRREFIQFFTERGHTFVPSSPLLPAEDPTLLFTNAGMNQFKDIFLGREQRKYTRATNTQKCIRAGGKHNDLEDVGHDTYHQTFFEMLGNWSFGDYFKAEAIRWAWELLTEVWGIPKDRLYATVFAGYEPEGLEPDDESRRLWRDVTDMDPSHVFDGSRTDNFWEMADVGPCGVNTEIHLDMTDDKSGASLVNAGDPRVVELWNLVFIQYNRDESGVLTPLPKKHVDTGMGFERLCAYLQGKRSNYATDLFVPIIEKIETLTDHRYGASAGVADRFDVLGDPGATGDIACRVVADHARALVFAIADGILPANEGRGYVLRRILRRAARYGRQYLNIHEPFLVELVPTIVDGMGQAFPEIADRQAYIRETIAQEEESFGRTLDRGIELFAQQADALAGAGTKQLPGNVAFDLYATYGFPADLTQVMAAERGMTVDMDGFQKAMDEHREISATGDAFRAAEQIEGLPSTDDRAKYSPSPLEAKVLGWVIEDRYITTGALAPGQAAGVVLDKTNFYGEQGGQVGDTGELLFDGGRFVVEQTQHAGPAVLHVGQAESAPLEVGAAVTCRVDPQRFDIMRNHTGTHLLNWALREVLGDHVNQAGSVVAADRLRFDFTHNKAVTADQQHRVEQLVNDKALADEIVSEATLPLAEARKIPGLRAVFGEKYPDPVRVISIGTDDPTKHADAACAIELCGGTHLSRTSQIGLFAIISEESVAKGVRRITAVTGREAVGHVQRLAESLQAATSVLNVSPEQLPERIQAMLTELKKLRKAGPSSQAAKEAARQIKPQTVADSDAGPVLLAEANDLDAAAMRNLCDQQRQKGAGAFFVGGVSDGKVLLVAMVSEQLASAGTLHAGKWVQAVAKVVGGGGGGKPTLAQAGGKNPEKLPEALAAAAEHAREKLAK